MADVQCSLADAIDVIQDEAEELCLADISWLLKVLAKSPIINHWNLQHDVDIIARVIRDEQLDEQENGWEVEIFCRLMADTLERMRQCK